MWALIQGPHFCISDVLEGVEFFDIDDVNTRKLYLECVRIVFKVKDFKAQIFQFVELAGEELLETHNPDAVSVFKQILNLRQEVGVVRSQNN